MITLCFIPTTHDWRRPVRITWLTKETLVENIQPDISYNYNGLKVTDIGDQNKWRRMIKSNPN